MGPLAALATSRVHVLLAVAGGSELLGLHVAAAVRRRGWLLVGEPAAADVLVVGGDDEGELRTAADRAWSEVPPPRARRRIRSLEEVVPALDSVARVLGDRVLQRDALPPRPRAAPPVPRGPAVRAVRLGPIRGDWPPGLVVDCAVRGELVIAADARVHGVVAQPGTDWGRFVLHTTHAARALRLAGWPAGAARLSAAVDRVLAGDTPATGIRAVRSVGRGARRSVLLRGGAWDRDLRARLAATLDAALRAASGSPAPVGTVDPVRVAGALIGRRLDDAPLLVAADLLGAGGG